MRWGVGFAFNPKKLIGIYKTEYPNLTKGKLWNWTICFLGIMAIFVFHTGIVSDKKYLPTLL